VKRRCLALFIHLAVGLGAQEPGRLTIERLHGSADFAVEGTGPLRWIDGRGFARLRPSLAVEGAVDIVRHDTFTGAETVLVAAADLRPAEGGPALRIEDHAFSADRDAVLLFTASQRVWRTRSRGDYWLFERGSKALRRLGGPDAGPSALQFAQFAPDARRIAYVRDRDLWSEDRQSGAVVRLTEGGGPTRFHGVLDWVYEEEFGLQDGFRWSPDGRHIAFWQIDDEGVGVMEIAHNLGGTYPRIERIPYPKVGTTNPAARIGVVPAGGGPVVWLDLPGDPRAHYLARLDWSPAGEVVVQQLDRRQQHLRVFFADPATGACREVFADRDPAWVEAVDPLHWVEDGRTFLWLSERGGWRQVWAVPTDGTAPRCLTPGAYDVIDLLAVEEIADALWIAAAPDDPTQRLLFRAPLSGGAAQRITPEGATGWHEYSFAPGCRYAVHTRSAFGEPPQVEVLRMPDHEALRVLCDNAGVRARLAALDRGEAGFLRVGIEDGLELDGWMIRPPDFDPARRWPVVVHVYGEPAAQTVVDRWGGTNHLWHLLLAQRGYVVMSFDNRGTPAPRGRAWRKVVHGQVGILAADEQARAVRAAARRFDWIDPERIGVWGWSGGGSMTLNALFRHPDLYAAGIAIAFVADQRLYDTIYQERYMGLLDENAANYREGSPITHVQGLAGDLLLVYGSVDDNTHYQNFERLVDALVAHDKDFDALPYPGRTHGLGEGTNTRRHLYRTMTRWFVEHLPPGPRR
jgi:dipeptidyl-peptidase-4